jgi:hypothetical protein
VRWPWTDNSIPAPGKFVEFLNFGNFYNEYSVRRDKPYLVAETGSTFHVEQPPGPGELAIKQAWWRQFITNSTFLDLYPKVKLISLFEFAKHEELTYRDWRITNKTEILSAFRNDFGLVASRYLLGNGTNPNWDKVPTVQGSNPGEVYGSRATRAASFIYPLIAFISLIVCI